MLESCFTTLKVEVKLLYCDVFFSQGYKTSEWSSVYFTVTKVSIFLMSQDKSSLSKVSTSQIIKVFWHFPTNISNHWSLYEFMSWLAVSGSCLERQPDQFWVEQPVAEHGSHYLAIKLSNITRLGRRVEPSSIIAKLQGQQQYGLNKVILFKTF